MIDLTVTPGTSERNPIPVETDLADISRRLGDTLIQAVCGRHTYPAGTTVGDFIAALRALGVRDSDPLDSIEYGIAQSGIGAINVERADGGGIEIREIR